MKKNAIATICAAVLAVALVLPAFLSNQPTAETPTTVQQATIQTDGVALDSSQNASSDADQLAVVPDEETAQSSDASDRPTYVPGTVLMGLADGVTIDQVNARLADYDFITTESVSEDDLLYGYVQLDLAEGVEVQDAIRVLEQADFVSAAQPDYIYYLLDEGSEGPEGYSYDGSYSYNYEAPATAAAASSDSDLQAVISADLTAQTTGINDPYSKISAADSTRWQLTAINAYEAWDYARADNSVTVAVLDSGVKTDHADLAGRVTSSQSFLTTSAADTNGHGTHVAGIIAATTNNNTGVAGVSYNAKIMSVQVIQSSGAVSTTDAALGVQYIVGHKNDDASAPVRVINMSFGGPFNAEEATDSDDVMFLNAIANAQSNNILVVCAAGNYANRVGHVLAGATTTESAYKCFPCDFNANMLGVINLTHTTTGSGSSAVTTYTRATGSNYNMANQTTKNISAPGETIYSTTYDGSYGYKSGTSMAAPVVSGVAALLFAANPSLSASDVRQILCNTATDLYTTGFDLQSGYGMVNAKAALAYAVPNAAPVISGTNSVKVGGTTQLSVSGGSSWSWSSQSTGVATVNASTGLVTGVSKGQAVITATSSTSGITLSFTVSVYDPSITGTTPMTYGTSQTLSVASGNPASTGTWKWKSSNTSVATIGESSGVMVARGCGTTDITVSLSTNSDISFTRTFTVSQADLAGATLGNLADQVYTGNAITLSNLQAYMPNVLTLSGYVLLSEGTDYTVAYSNNTDKGTATVTLTGTGNYTGTKTGTFRIGQATISGATLAGTGSYTYTGSAIQVTDLVVTADTSEQLVNGRDYTVAYENNVNAGVATAKITGMGNYVGERTAYFLINPKNIRDTDVTVTGVSDKAYTGSAQEQSPTVKWGNRTLTKGTDYTLSYQNNTDVGTATVRITGAGNFEPYSYRWNPILGAPYYYRVANTAPVYRAVTFSITKASLASAQVTVADQTYTGSALTPEPKVVLGGKTLTKGTDYTLSYSNNTKAGTATVTVTGTGNYKDAMSKTFKINAASVSKATITLSTSSYVYDGSAKKPTVTVKLNGVTLTQGTDYTVSYSNNTRVGTATVTITGKGNYTGVAYKNFTILNNTTTCTGATEVPVGATATYTVKDGYIAIADGSAYATLSGSTLTAKAAGTVTLSVRNTSGIQVATRTVTIKSISGAWTLQSAVNTGYVLDISGGSLYNGGNLQVYQSNNSGAQKFKFELQSDGYFRIISARNGKVLDVSGGSSANGANVQQYAWNSTNAQRWKMTVDSSNRITLVNKGSGRVLDVSGGVASNGRNVQQWDSNGTNAQKWKLASTTYTGGDLYDGVYRVTTRVNGGYALDVSGGSGANGANVQAWGSNGTAAQQWLLEHQGSGYYRLTCAASGKALDVSGGSRAGGANVQQWDWNGTAAQLWKLQRNSDGSYTLTNKGSGLVLDLAGGRAANGSNVWQYASNGTAAQRWSLSQL